MSSVSSTHNSAMVSKTGIANAYEFEADKEYAQLLIRGYPDGRTYDDVKRVIVCYGIRILKVATLSSNEILLLLDTEDMREIVLELTEQGYFVEGINALR